MKKYIHLKLQKERVMLVFQWPFLMKLRKTI